MTASGHSNHESSYVLFVIALTNEGTGGILCFFFCWRKIDEDLGTSENYLFCGDATASKPKLRFSSSKFKKKSSDEVN